MKKKILVADDDPGIRDVFEMILLQAGYSVELITKGEDILENKYDSPDLFLIDKQLCGIDGLDLCRYLKEQSSTAHIPIIMISASDDIATLSKHAGADDFIEKPFEMKQLLTKIEKYIGISFVNTKDEKTV
jgi:DNA-binding response OmpR family regulator